MHRSVNITYTYVNGYCLVVRLSCQQYWRLPLFRVKMIVVSGWSWIELNRESRTDCVRKLRAIGTLIRTYTLVLFRTLRATKSNAAVMSPIYCENAHNNILFVIVMTIRLRQTKRPGHFAAYLGLREGQAFMYVKHRNQQTNGIELILWPTRCCRCS